jgi:hypothetical protein
VLGTCPNPYDYWIFHKLDYVCCRFFCWIVADDTCPAGLVRRDHVDLGLRERNVISSSDFDIAHNTIVGCYDRGSRFPLEFQLEALSHDPRII